MKANQRIAVFQDLSGLGRCSLSASMPILTAFGAEVCACPTAVLSTQTDGFDGYTRADLTDQILPTARHWKKIGLTFDAVLTGFLPGARAIDETLAAVKLLSDEHTVLLVDPVLGDGGALYDACDEDMVLSMRALCAKAHYCTPNLTEARLLCDLPPQDAPSEEELHTIFQRMPGFGARIVTGIREGDVFRVAYQRRAVTGNYRHRGVEAHYVGAGDLFAATLLGALLCEDTLAQAAEFAAEFVRGCIDYTRTLGTPYSHGIAFEPYLAKILRHA